MRTESSEARWTLLRDINTARDNLALARSHYSNPRNVATAHEIGSEERGRYVKELEGMGPAQIGAMANVARATHNRTLVAALLLANDKIAKQSRPFDSSALAEEVFGADVAEVSKYFTAIDRTHAEVIGVNRAFEGDRIKPTDRILAGLDHGSGRILPTGDPGHREMSALEKLSAALDKDEAA